MGVAVSSEAMVAGREWEWLELGRWRDQRSCSLAGQATSAAVRT